MPAYKYTLKGGGRAYQESFWKIIASSGTGARKGDNYEMFKLRQ